MPMIVQFAMVTSAAVYQPSLTSWSRLEVQPADTDYAAALQARIADPLWLLARQWQFGEWRGEDAGTPVDVRLAGERTMPGRFHPGAFGQDPAAAAMDYDPATAPLEALVEAEDPAEAGLLAGALAAQQFQRMLAAAGVADTVTGLPDFALVLPRDDKGVISVDPDLDPDGHGWAMVLDGRGCDGHRLAAAIAAAGGVPAGVADSPGLKDVCLAWLDWYRGGLGGDRPSSWLPNRLEYGFAAGAGSGNAEVVLSAREYAGGRLDWHGLDLDVKPRLKAATAPVAMGFNPMLPTPARYGGMPADRFWEFEDARVNLARVDAGPTDLGRLLMLEFALGFGNDWFILPVELPVGSLFRLTRFQVTDTFGVTADIRRVANPVGESWRMFEQTASGTSPDSFLLAPAIDARLEGDPIEETVLFRDEMANMAWAVERKVPGSMGVPVDRYREASLREASRRLSDLSGVAPEIIYRVATSVPEHWIPFVAVPKDGQPLAQFGIDLQRRAMLRHHADGSTDTVQPRGVLLRTDLSVPPDKEPALTLEDEEVPREGVVLTRSAQFTRWVGGERLHWIGRRKRAGKGEGASGLRFDILERKGSVTS